MRKPIFTDAVLALIPTLVAQNVPPAEIAAFDAPQWVIRCRAVQPPGRPLYALVLPAQPIDATQA